MSYPYEHHAGKIGRSIKDIIYGATDGIITTFAVISGVVGASFSTKTLLILGFANIVADGFSMAASNYLGSQSQSELVDSELRRELREIEEIPEMELKEVREVLMKRGYSAHDAVELSERLMRHKDFFADFMMRYELGLNPEGDHHFRGALFTFFAFMGAGLMPLLPFLVIHTADTFAISAGATAVSLFAVGALRYFVTGKNWLRSGIEMFFVGGVAALVAYGIGYVLSGLV